MSSSSEPIVLGAAEPVGGRLRAAVRISAVLFALSLASRGLGLVREGTIAAHFGAGGEMDAFFVALRLPDFLLNGLLTFLVSTSFIPLFAELEGRGSRERAAAFTSGVAAVLALTLGALSAVLVLAAPLVIPAIAPGLDPALSRRAVTLTRVMLPALVFAGLAGVARSALNARGRFVVPALMPYVYNVSVILCVFLLGARLGVMALALGILLATALQWAAQLPVLRAARLPAWPSLRGETAELRRFGRLLAPVVVALVVGQVVPLVEVNLASHEPAGAISYLGFAFRIFSMPEQLFSATLATVLIPFLSRDVAAGRGEDVGGRLAHAMRVVLFITLPLGVLLAVLARPTVALLLGRGRFDEAAVAGTAEALAVFAVGLGVTCVRTLAVSTFFAFKATGTLLWVTAAMAVVNIGLDLVLVRHLSYVGLAVGATLTTVIHVALLLALLPRHTGPVPVFHDLRGLLGMLASTLVMAAVVALVERGLPRPPVVGDLAALLVGGASGVGVFVLGATVLRVAEGRDAWALFRRAIHRGR